MPQRPPTLRGDPLPGLRRLLRAALRLAVSMAQAPWRNARTASAAAAFVAPGCALAYPPGGRPGQGGAAVPAAPAGRQCRLRYRPAARTRIRDEGARTTGRAAVGLDRASEGQWCGRDPTL